MITRFACSFVVISCLSCTGVVLADSKAPSEIIRAVRILQDQVAVGNVNAQTSLPKALNQLAARLLEYPPDVWKEPKNLNALVIYILSGGQARVGKKVLESNAVSESERHLLLGALAYEAGNEIEAKKYLHDFDPRALPPALGSHVALVQGSLLLPEDPGSAMKSLDLARLLSPGTLIEESALRREVFLADDLANLDRFVFLADQYLRRFKTSLYFENFRVRFAASVVRFSQRNDAVEFEKLVPLVNSLKPDDELSIYLLVAQTSIINGKAISGQLAANQAARLAKNGTVEAARAKFYNTVVSVLQNDYENSLQNLDSLRDLPLPNDDAELKDVIIAMARQSHKTPESWTILSLPEPIPSGRGTNQSVNVAATALIDRVREKLAQTDEFVKDVSP